MHDVWTYLVGWDDRLVLKVGVTFGRRWRTFVNRGATLHLLHLASRDTPGSAVCDVEMAVEMWLGRNLPGAFSTKLSAVPYLGGSGGGYLECYQAPTVRAYRDALAACSRIMLAHPSGQCGTDVRALMHGRTDGHTYLEPHSPNATNLKFSNVRACTANEGNGVVE